MIGCCVCSRPCGGVCLIATKLILFAAAVLSYATLHGAGWQLNDMSLPRIPAQIVGLCVIKPISKDRRIL